MNPRALAYHTAAALLASSLLLANPRQAEAQTFPLPLPTTQDLQSALKPLLTLSPSLFSASTPHARAQHCTLQPDASFQCSCLHIDRPDLTLMASSWSQDSSGNRSFRQILLITTDGLVLRASSLRFQADSTSLQNLQILRLPSPYRPSTSSLSLQNLKHHFASSSSLLVAPRASLRRGHWTLERPSWYQLEAARCPQQRASAGRCQIADLRACLPSEPRALATATRARAKIQRASTKDNDPGWTLEGLQRRGEPSIDTLRPSQGPRSGLLPTELFSSSSLPLEISQSYFIAPAHLLLLASTSTRPWVGLGLGTLLDQPRQDALGPRPDPGLSRVSLEGRYDFAAQRLGAILTGRGNLGSPSSLLSWDLEYVSDPLYWSGRASAQRAFLRDWRASRLGLSLSGTSYHAQLSTLHILDPSLADRSADPQADPSALGASLSFGADLGLLEHLEAPLRLQHLSRDASAFGQQAHQLAALLGLRAHFGDPGSLHADLSLIQSLDLALYDGAPYRRQGESVDQRRTRSRSDGELIAEASAHLALEGRFDHLRHLFIPRIQAARRLLAVRSGLLEGNVELPTYAPFGAMPEATWSAFALQLDNQLIAPDWSLRLPLTLLRAAPDAELLQQAPDLQARLALQTFHSSLQLFASADLVCQHLCEDVRYQGLLGLQTQHLLRGSIGLSNLSSQRLALARADQRLAELTQRLRLFHELALASERSTQTNINPNPTPPTQAFFDLQTQLGDTFLGLTLWTQPDLSGLHGLSASILYPLRLRGFALHLQGASRPAEGTWAASFGFQANPQAILE